MLCYVVLSVVLSCVILSCVVSSFVVLSYLFFLSSCLPKHWLMFACGIGYAADTVRLSFFVFFCLVLSCVV